MRLLLRSGARVFGVTNPSDFVFPTKREIKITGHPRFVKEVREGLNRIKKYAPEHYKIAELYVKEIKYSSEKGKPSGVGSNISGSVIVMRHRDCAYDDYGDWFDSVLVHEIQHCDFGDGRKNYLSSRSEPAARYGTWLYCRKMKGFHGGVLAYLYHLGRANGYNEQDWNNRYTK